MVLWCLGSTVVPHNTSQLCENFSAHRNEQRLRSADDRQCSLKKKAMHLPSGWMGYHIPTHAAICKCVISSVWQNPLWQNLRCNAKFWMPFNISESDKCYKCFVLCDLREADDNTRPKSGPSTTAAKRSDIPETCLRRRPNSSSSKVVPLNVREPSLLNVVNAKWIQEN